MSASDQVEGMFSNWLSGSGRVRRGERVVEWMSWFPLTKVKCERSSVWPDGSKMSARGQVRVSGGLDEMVCD